MAYLEELLPEFRKGAKIRMKDWNKSFYYEMRNGKIYNQNGHIVNKFSHQALFENVWETYEQKEKYDWNYIIKNKYLCWFWKEENEDKFLGTLSYIIPEMECKFVAAGIHYFKHCRPVRRDEVTFYEDKEDDNC